MRDVRENISSTIRTALVAVKTIVWTAAIGLMVRERIGVAHAERRKKSLNARKKKIRSTIQATPATITGLVNGETKW